MGIASHVRRISPRFWFQCKFLRYKFYNGERELWLMRDLLRDCELALDIGSSIGLYSRELSRHARKVVAFEANPRVAAFARSVAPRNVEVMNFALSSSAGEKVLHVPLNRRHNTIDDLATIEPKNPVGATEGVSEKVTTRRLDDFGFTHCGFIKIDVEGHEEAVLDGAAQLIRNERPIMMIELEDRHNAGTVERVINRLAGLSYSAYRLGNKCLSPVAAFDPQMRPQVGTIDSLSPRRRTTPTANFIFVPEGAGARIPPRLLAA
jgi:FkbM family methyltransferase